MPWLLTYISDSLGVIASSIFGQSYLIGSGHWTLIRLQGYDFNQLTAGIVIAMLEGLLVWRAFWGYSAAGSAASPARSGRRSSSW